MHGDPERDFWPTQVGAEGWIAFLEAVEADEEDILAGLAYYEDWQDRKKADGYWDAYNEGKEMARYWQKEAQAKKVRNAYDRGYKKGQAAGQQGV